MGVRVPDSRMRFRLTSSACGAGTSYFSDVQCI